MMDDTAETILDYWFSPRITAMWFASTPELDAEIKSKFETLWLAASHDELDHWQATAKGALALVILLDQFPLNIYRGQAKSFVTEAKSIEVARIAVAAGFDKVLPLAQRSFLYMPFMHSEKPADQALSVKLFSVAGMKANLQFAEHHRELIRRFGRFPHRNEILGRVSRADEVEYLNSEQAFTG